MARGLKGNHPKSGVPFACRPGCGACCIAVSISSAIPGMAFGKPAGMRCVNLSSSNTCVIHSAADYPAVCRNLKPSFEMCGNSREDAMAYLERLEILTRPEGGGA